MKIKKSVQKAMQKFHVEKLRKTQIKPINDILNDQDVLVVAPTSSGKSLIYQLPASMQKDKLTLVLEPTLALMHDQVRKLVNLGIPAVYLDSTMKKKEIEHTLHAVRKSKIQILYLTPERLHTKAFLESIRKVTIYMVVVDECHFVLEWGDTFRPDYQRIGEFIKSLPKRPIVAALTATANPEGRDSIQKSLCMQNVQEHVSSIDRPNLVLLKENCSSSREKLLRTRHFIRKYRTNGSVIVYCLTRSFTDAVYNYLNKLYPDQVVRCHAGMKDKTRAQHESAFLNDEKKIMVATTAFGMGVDKGDIELIIHFNLPFSIGEYYRQAGRAGRDGRTAHCVLLYNTEQDFAIGKALAKEEKRKNRERMLKRLDAMAELALDNNHCMMQQVLAYFGEEKARPANTARIASETGESDMVEIGIHTFSLFHKLSYSDVQNLIEMLMEQGHCRKIKDDVSSGNRAYFSDYFSKSGVLIYLYQQLNGRSGISLRVTPCTALEGQYAATALYQPTKENYRKLTDILDELLEELELDFTSGDMSISRADPCANIHLDDPDLVAEYLRIFRKARVIRHYRVVTYQKDAKSVKDVKEANQHSYRQQSRRASFTAYDKRYVLQQLERCPDDLTGKGILRIEAELQREALLKRIKAKKDWSNERILKESAKRSARILSKYLRQLLGFGEHVRYQDAVTLIESAKMKKKMRERMLYLLRKTSDSNNLDRALAKLGKKYNLKESQINRVLKKFQKLGISPITLQNRSESNALPSLLSALD